MIKRIIYVVSTLTLMAVFATSVVQADEPCKTTGEKCGQSTYDKCSPVTCYAGQAAYYCEQSTNSKCNGTVFCSTDNKLCDDPKVVKAEPNPSSCVPTRDLCGQKTFDNCSPICTKDHKAAYFCFKTTNSNCQGIIQCDQEADRCKTDVQNVAVTGISINNELMGLSLGSTLKVSLPITDASQQKTIPQKIEVKLSDGSTKSYYLLLNFSSVNAFTTDIYIHNSITDQDGASRWAKDTIENFVNPKFKLAGMNKQFKVGKIVTNFDETKGCPEGSTIEATNNGSLCLFKDQDKIRVWIYKSGYEDQLKDSAVPKTSATIPSVAQTWLYIPNDQDLPGGAPFAEIDKRALTHELGHIFSLPDYYLEDSTLKQNEASGNKFKINAYVKDIMWKGLSIDTFSSTSREFVNRTTQIPVKEKGYEIISKYIPKDIRLQFIGDDAKPLAGIKVTVYPQIIPARIINLSDIDVIKIPNVKSMEAFADKDSNWEVDLGDYMQIFSHQNIKPEIPGRAAFIKVEYDSGKQIRYMALTTSELNTYFFQGSVNKVVIQKKFSELPDESQSKYTTLSIPSDDLKMLNNHVLQELKLNQ